jgi:Cu(I)-responsive transcriptional regulator
MPVSARPAASTDPRRFNALTACQIGEAAERSGVSAKMIRYYESIGLIRPAARSEGNYRTYDPGAVQRLRFIARARELGFSTEEIARLLALWQEAGRSSADVKAMVLTHIAALDAKIRSLKTMRAALRSLADDCHGDAQPDCPILDDLAGAAPSKAGRHG